MKKILILSYNFAPRQTVGVIRPTKLAQALREAGNAVDVVCVKPFGNLDHSFDEALKKLNITYIDKIIVEEKVRPATQQPKPAPAPAPQSAPKKKTLIRKVKTEGREILKITRSIGFAKRFEKLVKADKKKYSSYDACISSYGPVASHLCGLVMKKHCPGVKWIADFRDPMVVNLTTPLTKPYRASLQEKVCKKADVLVAVSNGYADRIFGERYKDKSHVVYNGFDRGDIDTAGIEPDGLFSFTYVGALYGGKRDIRPLFDVLKELCDEGSVDKNDIVIKYGGNNLPILMTQAAQFGLEDRIIDHGMLPRAKSLELQASSRHLIHATWNEKGENGVFPGKFLEYIMMGRSIISLVSGDEPNSEVTVVVKKAGLGVTFEEVTKDTDRAVLKEYILNDYKNFKAGKAPALNIDQNEVNRFDFANVAKQIEELI
ncbi:MAG: hypothetical protein IKT46_09830 [Clostridia bacterium]|nr:hypothetical protein [Clostridia bacterium]